jgi:hypothetical protein
MAIYRAQIGWNIDSALPRDVLLINPHFRDAGVGSDAGILANDLADAINTWDTTSTKLSVRIYDAEAAAPNFPKATATRNEATIASSNWPREVAVCLSYYAGQNVPRRRGRLYVPVGVCGSANTLRPSSALMQKVGDLAAIFENLGGTDVDWIVWSRASLTARSVTNWWVDDEWDTMRSRGLRSTTRLLGTTQETGP